MPLPQWAYVLGADGKAVTAGGREPGSSHERTQWQLNRLAGNALRSKNSGSYGGTPVPRTVKLPLFSAARVLFSAARLLPVTNFKQWRGYAEQPKAAAHRSGFGHTVKCQPGHGQASNL